jgi:hypothetical protein
MKKNNEQRGDDDHRNPSQGWSLFFNRLIFNNKFCETFCTELHFFCQEAHLAKSLTRCAQGYPQSLGISDERVEEKGVPNSSAIPGVCAPGTIV